MLLDKGVVVIGEGKMLVLAVGEYMYNGSEI